jgi:hypothetical protein
MGKLMWVCNTANPSQSFAGQSAVLFKIQLEFLITSDLALLLFPSTINSSSTFTIPDDAHPIIPASSCPDHEGVIGENDLSQQHLIDAGARSWEFNDMFNFDDLEMNFNFDGPSMSSSVAMDLSAHSATAPTTH